MARPSRLGTTPSWVQAVSALRRRWHRAVGHDRIQAIEGGSAPSQGGRPTKCVLQSRQQDHRGWIYNRHRPRRPATRWRGAVRGDWRRRLALDPLPVNEGGVGSVAFSRNGKIIVAGYSAIDGGGVVLLDSAAQTRLAAEPLRVKEGVVSSVAFGPDGRTIAVGYVAVGTGGGVAVRLGGEYAAGG